MIELSTYQKKRDFRKTPEPKGRQRRRRTKDGPIFVVQKHDASSLHYDLRLEMDGVLRSWAVPKGPSCDPKEKRLAVHVEDHPLDYAEFEGVIPQKEYGGGTVMVWDRGPYEAEGDPAQAYDDGRLKVKLHGDKLKGGWALVRMSGKRGAGGKNWLLIKERDRQACSGDGDALLEKKAKSVLSGRSIEQIAKDRDAVHHGKRVREESDDVAPAGLEGAKKAGMPRKIEPQLATLADDTPKGDNWLHEIKFDGYRLLAFIQRGEVRLITRNDKDWTGRFSHIRDALAELPVEAAVIDGEAVALDDEGVSRFQLMQNAMRGGGRAIVFYALDMVYCNGYDLRGCTQIDRKKLLARVVGPEDAGIVRYSDHVKGSGADFHEQACHSKLEGVVSKLADAPYRSGRTRAWIKSKCQHRQEFIIVGYTDPSGSRIGFGALLLGTHDGEGRLIYCGRVGTGFDAEKLEQLTSKLRSLSRKTMPLDEPPPRREQRMAHWVTPQLVAEVRFTEWTDDGRLRHPAFLGLREDKAAEEITREMPQQVEKVEETGQDTDMDTDERTSDGDVSVLSRVRLTNPQRVLYPEQRLTKRELVEYYEAVAERMLPYVADRPLSLVRCPRGRQEKCFYQKHLDESAPEALGRAKVPEKGGEDVYAKVEDVDGLASLVQLGVLEIHPWGARTDKVDRPDTLIFDLDPGPGTDWRDVIDAAHLFKEALDHLELACFCKLTGGKGVHVMIPIERRSTWDEAKDFCHGLARQIEGADPDAYTTNMSKSKRQGKVFLDYLRNSRGATAVAVYSTRARPNAPIATPIRWGELTPSLEPNHYTVGNIRRRLASMKQDPWDGWFESKQSITRSIMKEVGAA